MSQNTTQAGSTLKRADKFILNHLGGRATASLASSIRKTRGATNARRALGWGRASRTLLEQIGADERLLLEDTKELRAGAAGDFDVIISREPGFGPASHAKQHEVARGPSEEWLRSIAWRLSDQGVFGIHLPMRRGEPRLQWDALFRRLSRVGLWPRARLLLRELPLKHSPLRVRPAQFTSLGSHAVLVGERIPRAAFRMREAVRIALAEQGSTHITVTSGSMAPTYRAGEKVQIRPCASAHRGDVVLFERSSQLVLHRVLARVGGYLVQRGDATRERASLIRDWRVVACV